MAGSREIKQRIKSAKNISKITKAMEMVSASKMRRSQQQALSSRPYAQSLKEVLQKISRHTDPSLHPLLVEKEVGVPLLVIVSTDRGLCGSLNAQLFRASAQWLHNYPNAQLLIVGKKARSFARQIGKTIYAEFSGLPDKIAYTDTLPISALLTKGFLNNEFSSVHVMYVQSITTLTQQPVLFQLLPISPLDIHNPAELVETHSQYMFEPSPKDILNWLLPYYIENSVYFALLEAKASEHSARMISMKNASDNAKEIVNILNLEYNQKRQAHITQELQEITTAQLTLS